MVGPQKAKIKTKVDRTKWKLYVRYPFGHPYYKEYVQLCREAHLSSSFIQKSWCCIIQGLQRQADIIKARAWNTPNPEFLALGKLVGSNAKVLMTPLGLRSSTKLALWSGGLEISRHVRENGYETLESTLYGGLLDKMTNPQFKIWLGDDTWGPQGALWNTISAEYVKIVATIRDTMHVFMRTHDLGSVFYREELVNWQKAKGKTPEEPDGLTYHILVGMDSFGIEKVFKTEKKAKEYLLTFLGQIDKKFHKGMLEPGVNYRYRSEVWRDNERAFKDTFRKKNYQSYKKYINSPLPSIVRSFCEAEKATSPDESFDPKKFASVMDELLSKVSRVE